MKDLREYLTKIDGIDASIAGVQDRRDSLADRVSELTAEKERVLSKKVEIYDPPEGDRIEHLLAGDRKVQDKKVIDKRVLENIQLDYDAAQLEKDILLLAEGITKCENEVAGLINEKRNTFNHFLGALNDVMFDQYKQALHLLIDDHLIPLLALQNEGRGHGALHLMEGHSRLALGDIKISYWVDNRKHQFWPPPNDPEIDGELVDFKKIIDNIISNIRQAGSKKAWDGKIRHR